MLTFGLTMMSVFSVLLIMIAFRIFNRPWCGTSCLLGTVIMGYLCGILITLVGIVVWAVEVLL